MFEKYKHNRVVKKAQKYYKNAYPQGPRFEKCCWCECTLIHEKCGDCDYRSGFASLKDPRYCDNCFDWHKPEWEKKKREQITQLASQVAGGLIISMNIRGQTFLTESEVARKARSIATEIWRQRNNG